MSGLRPWPIVTSRQYSLFSGSLGGGVTFVQRKTCLLWMTNSVPCCAGEIETSPGSSRSQPLPITTISFFFTVEAVLVTVLVTVAGASGAVESTGGRPVVAHPINPITTTNDALCMAHLRPSRGRVQGGPLV